MHCHRLLETSANWVQLWGEIQWHSNSAVTQK
jgi:hypothetical protein